MNTRVVKFDKNGKYLMTWGEKGTPPNETRPNYMNTVHSIAIDAKRRVYVADRANSSIQIFDENGKFIELWPNVRRPYYIMMAADQHLWVVRRHHAEIHQVRSLRQAPVFLGHLRRIPWRLLGRSPVQRRRGGQSLYGGRARRPAAEVPAQGRC